MLDILYETGEYIAFFHVSSGTTFFNLNFVSFGSPPGPWQG